MTSKAKSILRDLGRYGVAYEYTDKSGIVKLLDPTRVTTHTRSLTGKLKSRHDRFEYKSMYCDAGPDIDMLQDLGQGGWELCSQSEDRYILKRKLP